MRRSVIPLAVLAVAAALAAPSRATPDTRTPSRPYSIDRAKVHLSDVDPWVGTQREFFRARPGERWVSVSLRDESGQPVRGRVEIVGDVVEFCSEMAQPVRVRPGQEVAVSAILGPCGTAPSVVTRGRITATFSGSAS